MGYGYPQKIFNLENFPNYGSILHIKDTMNYKVLGVSTANDITYVG